MIPGARCDACQFWDGPHENTVIDMSRKPGDPWHTYPAGYCRRWPPPRPRSAGEVLRDVETDPAYWCGEFKVSSPVPVWVQGVGSVSE